MGCTPSIQVSQTGVVYCRESAPGESDESDSPRPSSNAQGILTQTVSTTFVGSSGSSNKSSGSNRKVIRTSAVTTVMKQKGHTSISEAETQTGFSVMKSVNNINLGPMRIKQHTLSVMLLFGKEDAQSDAFWWAAEHGGYHRKLVHTEAEARECYKVKPPDVIIIDARHKQYFSAESVCRHLRTMKGSEYTVIVAITKHVLTGKEEGSVLPLLSAGFNRRIMENHNANVCLNELQMLELSEVSCRVRLRAAAALVAATELSNDAIEVTSEDYEMQYVNPTFEEVFGYTSNEVLGTDSRELPRSEKNRSDIQEVMNSYLQKGETWRGVYVSKRKSGDNISHHCQIMPVMGQSGKVRHYVSIKTPLPDIHGSQSLERCNGDISLLPGMNLYNRHRRESVVRMHSMTIEAPITKVINMINTAQENSPIAVAQSLEKVLEILRSSELYSTYFSPQAKDDQMTHDLVGGLMTTNVKKHSLGPDNVYNKTASELLSSSKESSFLTQASPAVQNLLVSEADWSFDIMTLERLTEKKPLVHLGLKVFRRFGVLEILRITDKELSLWLHMIEENYHSSNTYHNSTHAADVMHASAYFLCRDKIKNLFDPMDEVASLIAAVVHDLDHPGRTNSFLVNSGNQLALLYNDLAVLESHHVSLAFRLSERDPRVNIFKNLDRDDYHALRQQVIDMVLATEMTKHFEHLNKFISVINQPVIRDDDGSTMRSANNSPDSNSICSHFMSPENKTLIKRMLIKCADVSNPLRPFNLCKEWAYRISDEYFQQTDEEKEKNLPVVMPVFDRKTCKVPMSQISFVDFFINDMFDAWDSFCDIPEAMEHMRGNYNLWKVKHEEAERGKLANSRAEEL